MSTVAVSAGNDVRVGRVLSRAFELLLGSLIKFLVLTGIVWLPLLGYQAFFYHPSFSVMAGPGRVAAVGTAGLGQTLISLSLIDILSTVSQAAQLFDSFQQMRGRPFAVGESLQKGLGRFLPVLGTAICVGLGVGFASLLLIVPGLILAAMWYVAIPACVLEGAGPFAALSRSSELTKGSRWKVVGVALLIFLIIAIPAAVVQGVLGYTLGWTGVAVGSYLARVVGGAFGAIVAAVLYHDLRVAREGIDTDRIAAVFD